MSVTSIDSHKTTSRIVNGITIYQNPALMYDLYSDGRIYSHKSKKFMQKTANGTFSVSYSKGSGTVQGAKFESLICHFLGIKRSKRSHVKLIDERMGFIPGNISVVSIDPVRKAKESTDNAATESDLKTISPALHEAETSIICINGYRLKSTQANLMYITEDVQTFDNLFDANSHQMIVDKGKEAAQLVLNSNSGFILAEQIFDTHVKNITKKYKNFKDVIENNKGVQEIGKSDTFKFIDQPGLGEFKKEIIGNEFTYDQAEKLANLLKVIDNSSLEIIDLLK